MFVDQKKVNTVDLQLLFKKLAYYGIRTTELRWHTIVLQGNRKSLSMEAIS